MHRPRCVAGRGKVLSGRIGGRRGLVLVAALLAAGTTHADPNDYVYMPTVTQGEREVDFKYGIAGKGGEASAQAASLGVGYGATDSWFTEFYVKGARDGAQSQFDAFEFENKFQLTETGRFPLDVGLITEFEFPHDRREGNEFRFGPLFQAEVDRWQFNFNPLLTNVSRATEDNGTYFDYQWQVKYRWRQAIEFGAQGFGDTGRWDHWLSSGEQSHRLGPAAFGKVGLGGGQAIVWNAALLFGVTQASPDWNFRMQAEYEF